MTCAQCGKEIKATWLGKKPIAHVIYATASGPVILCSVKCDTAWCSK